MGPIHKQRTTYLKFMIYEIYKTICCIRCNICRRFQQWKYQILVTFHISFSIVVSH